MNPAATPVPVDDVQGDKRWMSMHTRFMHEAKEKEPEVLFLGDSIIQQLGQKEIWEKLFEPLHCQNFGIGGDQTQHVLWRLQNGELENLAPKVIVMCVGTNNHEHTAEQVVGGIMTIVETINEKQPQAQIIVMGIPPRGREPNPLREKIAEINAGLADQLEPLSHAQMYDVDAGLFVNADGNISHRDMYDYLHFTKQGYLKLVEPLLEEVQTILKNFMTADTASAGDPELG